jgi:hypothetical protein
MSRFSRVVLTFLVGAFLRAGVDHEFVVVHDEGSIVKIIIGRVNLTAASIKAREYANENKLERHDWLEQTTGHGSHARVAALYNLQFLSQSLQLFRLILSASVSIHYLESVNFLQECSLSILCLIVSS